MRRFSVLLVLLVSAFGVAPAAAADPVNVRVVEVEEEAGRLQVTVSITDAQGRPVPNLNAAAVRAALDGANLPVTSVSASATAANPIAVVLLVDVSGSMAGEPMVQSRAALQEFVRALDPVDPVAIIAFDSTVRVLQDFTTNRTLLSQAINRLVPVGNTALFDAVIAGVRKASEAQTRRKLVVLLSDGEATVGLDKRQASLDAAREGGIPVVAIGLGNEIDRRYLDDLARASKGTFIEAPTAASVSRAYMDLAASIRSQYLIRLSVPPGVDRSVAGKLSLQVRVGSDTGTVEYSLPPLPGAVPPPLTLTVEGVTAGQTLREAVTVSVTLAEGVAARVELRLGDVVLFAANEPPYAFQLYPENLPRGNHLLSVVATDARGRQGERQVAFTVQPPAARPEVPVIPLAGLLAAGGVLFLLLRILRRRRAAPGYEGRIKPWAGRGFETKGPRDLTTSPPATGAEPGPVRPLGRVIVMDEAAVRGGSLDAIREFDVYTGPLVIGSSASCDIVLEAPEDYIAGEEARVWVQNGKLVYHKLTTLSAMATEGVTSGWLVLQDGEDIALGRYRIIFKAAPEEPRAAAPERTARLGEIWPRRADEQAAVRSSYEQAP